MFFPAGLYELGEVPAYESRSQINRVSGLPVGENRVILRSLVLSQCHDVSVYVSFRDTARWGQLALAAGWAQTPDVVVARLPQYEPILPSTISCEVHCKRR